MTCPWEPCQCVSCCRRVWIVALCLVRKAPCQTQALLRPSDSFWCVCLNSDNNLPLLICTHTAEERALHTVPLYWSGSENTLTFLHNTRDKSSKNYARYWWRWIDEVCVANCKMMSKAIYCMNWRPSCEIFTYIFTVTPVHVQLLRLATAKSSVCKSVCDQILAWHVEMSNFLFASINPSCISNKQRGKISGNVKWTAQWSPQTRHISQSSKTTSDATLRPTE